MYKIMHYFSNKFFKSPSAGGLSPQRPFTFDFGGLKLRDLNKLWSFKLIMTKSNFKISYDVIVITSPKIVTKLTSQDFSISLPIKISDYAGDRT